MNNLTNFRLVGHFFNDYRSSSAETFEYWIFAYTGSKRVASFVQKDDHARRSYNANLVVGKRKNWEGANSYFVIRVANGLTYDED